MPEFVHQYDGEGEVITFSWLGEEVEVEPVRVYALAFTPEGSILLVSDDPALARCWIPGGGIEEGETAEEALARELIEEANARILQCRRIGFQQAEDANGDVSYQAFYWCRIVFEPGEWPEYGLTYRTLVQSEAFLDRLFWGRTDPKAPMLLERALAFQMD